MARRSQPDAPVASPLRLALAERISSFADRWELTGERRRARAEVSAACIAGQPVVVEAVALCLALNDAGDERWRQYRYDASDSRNERRWLLTETDQIIGPLSSRQLSDLGADHRS